MAKNIVVCCDGTSNEFAKNRTNVAKLCLTLAQVPGVQELFYHPGLGTMEPPGALTGLAARVTKILGLAFGYGLQNDIRDAYVFLMNHYEPGDRVFIFGFSRGAYTARALAGLLHMYGLLRPGNEPLVPYAIRMMFSINGIPEHAARANRRKAKADSDIFALASEFKRTFSITCKPHFVGVWDTVNSVGLFSRFFRLPYTANNPDIAIGRHALAIDEHRGFFRPSLWWHAEMPGKAWGPKSVLQVWFAGSHCDVGGGFAEEEASVSKCALAWMMGEAASHGLLFDHPRVDEMFGRRPSMMHYVPPDPCGPLHNSMNLLWAITEFVPKKTRSRDGHLYNRINRFRRRHIDDSAFVHESVFARGMSYRDRCRNFPKTPQIARTNPIPESAYYDPPPETQ